MGATDLGHLWTIIKDKKGGSVANCSSCPLYLWAVPVHRVHSGCLVMVEPTGLPWGRDGNPFLSLPAGWPNLWGKHLEEVVNINIACLQSRGAKTFDLSLPAPGSGLLLSLQRNNLNSTWRTKRLIKWNQISFPRSRGKSSKQCIRTFNEAEMLCSGTSDT